MLAEFRARPGHEAAVAELVARHMDVVRAEPGNVTFEPHRTSDDDARFLVYEVYRDREAFTAHVTSASSRAFNEQLKAHITTDESLLTMLEDV